MESNQTGHAVLKENKRFHAHVLKIIGYYDSDFFGCQDSKRSTSGYVLMLAGGVISWRSAKQTLIASSTMAGEFIVCYEASNHGIWLRNFVTGLDVVKGIERPLKLYCDNNSAVLYSKQHKLFEVKAHLHQVSCC